MNKAYITVDLGFGDAGKGKTVAALVRKHASSLVVRYNGGAQAAHNVISNGVHHTFSQFGSGTLDGAATLLSKHMLVNPLVMELEAKELAKKIHGFSVSCLLSVDERALVTTPYHRAVNRLKELSRKDKRHGSCGLGIGETMADFIAEPDAAIRVADLRSHSLLMEKLVYCKGRMWEKAAEIEPVDDPEFERQLSTFRAELNPILERYHDFATFADILTPSQVADLINDTKVVVFEGAQGVLLHQDYGFHPHTTWSDTTSANAYEILEECNCQSEVKEIGVVRTFATRHGAGPFPTEETFLAEKLQDSHNGLNDWQKAFRVGWFDFPLLRYALAVNGPVDTMSVTHTDILSKSPEWKMCYAYQDSKGTHNNIPFKHSTSLERQQEIGEWLTKIHPRYWTFDARQVVGNICDVAKAPLEIESSGPETEKTEFREVLQPA
jgi:adenylosuccinate synthase